MSGNSLENKVVLVTGAAGSIGSALCRRISQLNPKLLILFDQDETGIFDLYEDIKDICSCEYVVGDIRQYEDVENTFKAFNPEIVYHAAAYKHVALMEKYPLQAFFTNVVGTKNVADLAEKYGCDKFVFISTDKAANPTCVMGKSKLMAEDGLRHRDGHTKFIIVRFGNVMASRGSVIPIFNKLISENKDLPVTSPDMERYFMGIYEAVDLVLKATEVGSGGDTIILDMGNPMKIDDLAKMMIKLSGKPLNVYYTNPKEGEKYTEVLMTDEERGRATKEGNLFIIHAR